MIKFEKVNMVNEILSLIQDQKKFNFLEKKPTETKGSYALKEGILWVQKKNEFTGKYENFMAKVSLSELYYSELDKEEWFSYLLPEKGFLPLMEILSQIKFKK